MTSVIDFSFEALRRWPDAEAPNLHAVDATDRLLLDEAEDSIRAHPNSVLVIDDNYGALTLGAIALGARGVRVHQDSVVAERALAANAGAQSHQYAHSDLEKLSDVRVVLWQLPRSLERLDDIAGRLATALPPEATVFAGGRIKHMTTRMNEVLSRHFGRVDVSHARQKSRLLIAREPVRESHRSAIPNSGEEGGVAWMAEPGVFAGGRLDNGTRALLAVIDTASPDARTAVDLGCGSGVLAAALAAGRPAMAVLATDVSAVAVASARRTAELNKLTNMTVLRDDAASTVADSSVDLVVLNPPFHTGSTVHTGVASRLFAAAARILRPGGELLTVYNSHLNYRGELTRVVGATEELARNPKFTVTRSRKR